MIPQQIIAVNPSYYRMDITGARGSTHQAIHYALAFFIPGRKRPAILLWKAHPLFFMARFYREAPKRSRCSKRIEHESLRILSRSYLSGSFHLHEPVCQSLSDYERSGASLQPVLLARGSRPFMRRRQVKAGRSLP